VCFSKGPRLIKGPFKKKNFGFGTPNVFVFFGVRPGGVFFSGPRGGGGGWGGWVVEKTESLGGRGGGEKGGGAVKPVSSFIPIFFGVGRQKGWGGGGRGGPLFFTPKGGGKPPAQ